MTRHTMTRRAKTRRPFTLPLVVLVVAALVGAAACTGSHSSSTKAPRPAVNSAAAKTAQLTDAPSVPTDTWMKALAPQLWDKTLGSVVITASHDTGTYGLDGPAHDYAGTQNQSETIIDALNQGIRQLDLRAEYHDYGANTGGADWWAHHGNPGKIDSISTRLRLSQMLDQVKQFALAPGHEQEIVLVHLSVDGPGAFPTAVCKTFTDELGSALLTPDEAGRLFGTQDPGKLTFKQLWTAPGQPRVILDNTQCMGIAAGQPGWSYNLYDGGYYANQCYAPWSPPFFPGIQSQVLLAARNGATDAGGGDIGGTPEQLGPAKAGGFTLVYLQATTTLWCAFPLKTFDLAADRTVLAALNAQWWSDPMTRQHVNVIGGDFVEETDLVKDVLAMDESLPVRADGLTRAGQQQVVAVQGDQFAPGAFDAMVTAEGAVADAPVTYTIRPYEKGVPSPNIGGTDSVVVSSQGGVAHLPNLSAGPHTGTWTLTASLPGGLASTTWTLVVEPVTQYNLAPGPHNLTVVQVQKIYDGFTFTACTVNTDGVRVDVPNVPVTFDTTTVGFWPKEPGSGDLYKTTTGDDGCAIAPPKFQGDGTAGARYVSVSSTTAATISLPVTVLVGEPNFFKPSGGSRQTTPINTTFPQPLTGYYYDIAHNREPASAVTPDMLGVQTDYSGPNLATWADGSTTANASLGPDGLLTAPPLRAAATAADAAHPVTELVIMTTNRSGGWSEHIAPGPPTAVTATGGDGQQAAAGQPFAQPLAVKVTDAGGNTVPGASVSFQVTSGAAMFGPVDANAVAVARGDDSVLHVPNPPRTSVVVPADVNGIATAPVLTAGTQTGPVAVTASAANVTGAKPAGFSLSVNAAAPGAPAITNLTNGDGQVGVGFSPATPGTSPVTSYEVTASDVTHPGAPQTATGPGSPIVVTGLTNGDTYQFTVTAVSADGMKTTSPPSGRINVGVGAAITGGPADGTVGQAYSSRFTVTGAPAPTVTQLSGDLPPGLSLHDDGTVTGTPTTAGSSTLTVQATNDVGISQKTVTITIRQ